MPTSSQSTLCQTGFDGVTNIQSVSHTLHVALLLMNCISKIPDSAPTLKTFLINKSPDCSPEVTCAFSMMIMLMRHSIDQTGGKKNQ